MANPCPSSSTQNKNVEKDKDAAGTEKEVYIIPVGYQFAPTNVEIFESFLMNKILGRELPSEVVIKEIDVFKHDPDKLPQGEFRHGGTNTAYFFTIDEGKSTSGEGTRRSTVTGYWEIYEEQVFVVGPEITGIRSNLIFYEGKAPEGKETAWRMSQYRVKLEPGHADSLLTEEDAKDRMKYSMCKVWQQSDSDELSLTRKKDGSRNQARRAMKNEDIE